MGREAAVLFAREGARVVVVDVVDDAGAADGRRRARAPAAKRRSCAPTCRSGTTASRWCATATDTYGALHVLYNNAGIFPADDGGVLDTPESTWERVMDVNLEGRVARLQGRHPGDARVGRRRRSSTSRRSSR